MMTLVPRSFLIPNFVLGAIGLSLLCGSAAHGQRLMEKLGRGVVVMRMSTTSVYVGWRLLGGDPENIGFNLYRVTGGITNLLTPALLANACNFVDSSANLTQANSYFVRTVMNRFEHETSVAFTLPANAPVRQYLSIPLTPPAGGTSPPTANGENGGSYIYNANDCSAGDLDGDGEYEIVLKWDPSNSKDNSQSGFTGNTILDAYRLDGMRLWRIDLGPNIRSGAHYTHFMVFDFDGDGRAEIMCRTAPGAMDGAGSYVGGVAKWQNANGPRPSFNNTDDYRNTGPNGVNGYVLAGPEFLTVFDGETGVELATAGYYPKRDQDNNNDNPTSSRINTVWGDGYGNRIDRFLAGVAYLDGRMPSGIFCRGYYTRAFLVAWNWRDGKLTRRWVFDTNDGTPGNTAYRGQGAHSLTIGDVDGDGKDEIVYGAAAIDDNGKGLYSTRLGHGDALHLSDMDPDRSGLEVWMVHESPGSYGPAGLEFRDAANGDLIFGVDGQNVDIGRGVAIDIDPRHRGYEMWGSRGGLMSATGVQISGSKPSQQNFAIWWDADVLREILDGTTISKWNWLSSSSSTLFGAGGVSSVNGTKANPSLSADLLGDWREEVIWRTSNNSELRIYTTTTVSTNRFYTLMHDPQYRCAIAWQNTGYNQPPHPGFSIGPHMSPPPLLPISDAQLVWRGGMAGNTWDVAFTANWRTNGVWSTNNPATLFTGDSSVLFEISGSNQTPVNFTTTVSPSKVTVFAPGDFVFDGTGSISGPGGLVKAGQGRLTINTANTFSGGTTVSGGAMFVNGALDGSPVIVERRGTPEGPSQFGGGGRLGQGLKVLNGCILIVGPDINAAGALTISNQLVELGGVLNRFDLSNDPTGPGGVNDRIDVVGDVSLSGTNVIEINQLDGFLGGGVYPLIRYTGTLLGGLTNLALAGSFIQPVVLTNPPGQIALMAILPDAPPVAPVQLAATAIGAFQINLVWNDSADDENATLIERSTGNALNFSQIAAVDPDVTNHWDIGLAANTTYYYRVRGTNLAGFSAYSNTESATTTATPPSLAWRGDGSENIWNIATTANWFNGSSLTFYADGSFVTFENSGSNSPSINLVQMVEPGSMTVTGTKNYTLAGNGGLAGPAGLVKSGSSTVTLRTTNTFSGGTIISNGTVAIGGNSVGGYTANSYTLGSGAVTFRGGRLAVYGYGVSDNTSGYGTLTNRLIVESGQAGTLLAGPRQTIASRVTGAGTLALSVDYVRGDVGGDWTGFTGNLNVTATKGTPSSSTMDDFRVATASGFPAAKLSIATNVFMYSRAGSGNVIPIGQFSGSLGAVVSAGSGSGVGAQNPVTWRVGGMNTDATNAALFQGTTSLIKEGTGRWTLTGNNTYTGATVVNAGRLIVNGDQSAASGAMTVGAAGALGGMGVVGGNVVINGQLAPGTSIGTLIFAGSLILNPGSSSVFELRRTPLTNDVARVSGGVTYGGALVLVNVSPEFLEAGDRFKLFDAPAYGGAFTSFDLPELEEGLVWNTSRLNVDGSVWVVRDTPPVISLVVGLNEQMTFNGDGGTPDWFYYVLASTNVALPVNQWSRVATNQFDSFGGFAFATAVSPEAVQRFYRLQLP
jgi:autotransporter-associated beta strand protein